MSASDIPIDIGVSKMLDWLVDRRHCTARWQKSASVAQKSALEAMKESEKDEIAQKICEKLGANVSSLNCYNLTPKYAIIRIHPRMRPLRMKMRRFTFTESFGNFMSLDQFETCTHTRDWSVNMKQNFHHDASGGQSRILAQLRNYGSEKVAISS